MPHIDHIAIHVSDLSRSITFYTQRLGFSLLFSEVDPVHHEAFAFLQAEGCQIELLQLLNDENKPNPFPPQDPSPPYCPHIAIRTSDLDQVVRELHDNGITIVKGPLEIQGKVKWLYLGDPDGNMLEYVQWL